MTLWQQWCMLMPSTAALVAFAVRWTDCELPEGSGVMRMRIRTRDTVIHG